MIDITSVDLKKFVKEVYALSSPAGLGFLHFKPGELSDEAAQAIIDRGDECIAASMDYVNGRQCKMTVFRKPDGKLEIGDNWFDHSTGQLTDLLERCGIAR